MTPNLATLVSLTAFVAMTGAGVAFAALARAPRWARARTFAVLALSAAGYAGVDVLFSLSDLNGGLVRALGVLNYLFAAVHACAWVVHAYSTPQHPWRDLSPRLRLVVGVTLGLGVVSLFPHVMNTDEVRVVALPSLGVVYHQPETTPFADAVSAWVLGVLMLPYVAFVRALLRREPGAGVWVAGFTVFFLCGVAEALVTNGVFEFLFLGDVGLVAIVMSMLVDSVRGVRRDAQALEALGLDLAGQVERRTQERDEARSALQHAERLASLGQLAAGVGHEINNPLSYVRANLQELGAAIAAGRLPDDATELVQDSIEGTNRILRVVGDLRAYALPVAERRERVSLRAVLDSAQKLAAHHLRHIAKVTEDIADDVPLVSADSVRLGQVFVNLLVNAGNAVRDAKPESPSIVVRARRGNGHAVVEVQDNGVGIPAGLLQRLGEPYFSTRIDRGGSGLGLFVTRGIVASFGGKLEFESTVGQGTVARVVLPEATGDEAAPAAAASRATQTASSPGPGPGQPRCRVLIIDDEPSVARALSRMIRDCAVTIASDGQQAARLLTGPDDFDLVLCDVMMPGLTGAQLYDRVAAARPALLPRFVFVTGGGALPEVAAFLGRDGVQHLAKPFDRDALERVVEQAKERARGAAP